LNDQSSIPYASAAPIESVDDGHLKAIVICHYVWGTLILLLSCFAIIYIVMGMMIVNGNWPMGSVAMNTGRMNPAPMTTMPTLAPMTVTPANPAPLNPVLVNPAPVNPGFNAMPPQMGYMFVCMGSGGLFMGWLVGILTIVSGRAIAQRKWRMFSLVIAGVNCASFPLGTLLGVFTFIVLLRNSVRALYPA
jgi:hypothetical protein